MLCLLRVPLYLWDTTSLLVRLIWSHLHEPSFVFLYAFLVLYCLAGALCGCVRYTPLVIYFHIGAFMLMSDALISDLFPLLVIAAWIWISCSCYLLLLRIFIRSVPFSFDLPFSAFYCLLRTGIVCWKSSLGGNVCDCLFLCLRQGFMGEVRPFMATIIKSSKKASGKGFVINPHTVQFESFLCSLFASSEL